MTEKLPEFTTQIKAPEEPLRSPGPLSVNEGEPLEAAIEQCRESVEIRVANMLHATLKNLSERILALKQVEDSGITNNIELLYAALSTQCQKIQFAQYDVKYGLNEHPDSVVAPLNFAGEAFDALSFLEGVTWITEVAKRRLSTLIEQIQDLQEIIQRAENEKNELDDEPQNKRERATLQKTIDTRTPRKEKKVKAKQALVVAINDFLEVDSENQEALLKAAEKLLAFLIQSGAIEQDDTFEKASKISDIPEQIKIQKNIIPVPKTPREKRQYAKLEKKKKPGITRQYKVMLGLLGLLTLGAAASPLLKSYLEKNNSIHTPQRSAKRYQKPRTTFSRGSALSSERQLAMVELQEYAEQIRVIMLQERPKGPEDTRVDKVNRLQDKMVALNKRYNLGVTIGTEMNFPRTPLHHILDKIDYNVDLATFQELLTENAYMTVNEMFQYRADNVMEEHFIGKIALFTREYNNHLEGPVKMSAKAIKTKETTTGMKFKHATLRGAAGKALAISTVVDVEIKFVGAINKVIKKPITVAGIRFVPHVPHPKTYMMQTPKGPTFLTMEQLKKLNLRPGDYISGFATRRNADGSLEVSAQPKRQVQMPIRSMPFSITRENDKTIVTIKVKSKEE